MEGKARSRNNRIRLLAWSWFLTLASFFLLIFVTLAWFNILPPFVNPFFGGTPDVNVSARLHHLDRLEALKAGELTPQIVLDEESYNLVNSAFQLPLWPGESEYLMLEVTNNGSGAVNLTLTLSGIKWGDSPALDELDENGKSVKDRLEELIKVNVFSPNSTRYSDNYAYYLPVADYDGFCEIHYMFGAGGNLVIVKNFSLAAGATEKIYFSYSIDIAADYPPTEGPLITIDKITLTVA